MATTLPLSLSDVPRGRIKYDIISTFFGLDRHQAQNRLGEYTDFFHSYSTKLRELRFRASGSTSLIIDQLAARSHEDILRICKALAHKKHLQRADIREILRTSFNEVEDRAVDRSIDLALRLWLMINVRDDELGINEPRKSSSEWADTETLQGLICRLFPTSETKLTVKEARLGTTFNAAYMFDICGLEIDWTDNLQDHLLLNRRTRTLYIFADQGFLFGQLNAATCISEWYDSSPWIASFLGVRPKLRSANSGFQWLIIAYKSPRGDNQVAKPPLPHMGDAHSAAFSQGEKTAPPLFSFQWPEAELARFYLLAG